MSARRVRPTIRKRDVMKKLSSIALAWVVIVLVAAAPGYAAAQHGGFSGHSGGGHFDGHRGFAGHNGFDGRRNFDRRGRGGAFIGGAVFSPAGASEIENELVLPGSQPDFPPGGRGAGGRGA